MSNRRCPEINLNIFQPLFRPHFPRDRLPLALCRCFCFSFCFSFRSCSNRAFDFIRSNGEIWLKSEKQESVRVPRSPPPPSIQLSATQRNGYKIPKYAHKDIILNLRLAHPTIFPGKWK